MTDLQPTPDAAMLPGRDVMAERLARLFQEVLESRAVEVDDDFFHLGGDSLLAESLMARIEGEFGVSLPISVLPRSSTPGALADTLLAEGETAGKTETERPCLVPIRADGEGAPLFVVHGMDGETSFPRRLAGILKSPRPLYAFRAIGLDRGETPIATVAKTAARYIEEIRAERPTGPYVLCGQCPAAMIAYEMARQFLDAGETVAGLVLLDPYPPMPWLQFTGMRLFNERLQLSEMYSRLIGRMPVGGYLTAAGRHKLVFDLFRPIVGAYAPKPYPGPTLLVCTSSSAPMLLSQTTGFPSLTSDLETARIGVEHLDPFKEKAPETAAVIEAFLARVAPI